MQKLLHACRLRFYMIGIRAMLQLLARFQKDQSGATAIEYGLIAAGISVAIIVVVQGLGTNLNASAALMLGGTFDPLVQRQSGAVPDIAQARRWYKRAAELGSNAAAHQLDNLANMGP
jgi:pilus assembly protein Flp/PilA